MSSADYNALMFFRQKDYQARMRGAIRFIKDFACPICFEPYITQTDAKVAQCGHTLCGPCWAKVISAAKAANHTLHCPMCRTDIVFEPQTNIAMTDLFTEMKTLGIKYNPPVNQSEELKLKVALRIEEKKMELEEKSNRARKKKKS